MGYRNVFGEERIASPLFVVTSGVKPIVEDWFFGRDEQSSSSSSSSSSSTTTSSSSSNSSTSSSTTNSSTSSSSSSSTSRSESSSSSSVSRSESSSSSSTTSSSSSTSMIPYEDGDTFIFETIVVVVDTHDESYQDIIVRTETAAAILFLIDCTIDWGAAGRP